MTFYDMQMFPEESFREVEIGGVERYVTSSYNPSLYFTCPKHRSHKSGACCNLQFVESKCLFWAQGEENRVGNGSRGMRRERQGRLGSGGDVMEHGWAFWVREIKFSEYGEESEESGRE
jgi:hypothetical protein